MEAIYAFMAHRAPALVAALVALLAVPASASADAPWPCLLGDQSLLTPVEGQPHDFDATCSSDPDGHELVSYEWDVDGDGAFETSTGSVPLLTHTFTGRGDLVDATVEFGVKVTDAAGESDSFSLPLRVTDRINSWFTFSPQLVNPGDTVELTATTNPVDPAPALAYAWDLDGDGAFETPTGAGSTASLVAPQQLGRRPVSLQVSDDLGNVSTIKREIEVLPRHPSRDLLPWNAPANLGEQTTLAVQATGVQTVVPVGPAMPPVETGGATTKLRRPVLKRISASRRGLRLRYAGGPKWSRWSVAVRLPANRAANYGLPRRTIVLARGRITFDGQGVGRTPQMRWSKGAYRIFRRVNRGIVDILARRVA